MLRYVMDGRIDYFGKDPARLAYGSGIMNHKIFMGLLSLGLLVAAVGCDEEETINSAGVGGGGGGASSATNSIAPLCDETFCAEADVKADLDCYDYISEQGFTTKLAISGKVESAFCGIEGEADQDLHLRVRVQDEAYSKGDYSEVGFALRSYTGPGTYPLYNLEDEYDHMGLKLTGNTNRPPGEGNDHQTIGTWTCTNPPPCEAVVAEGSELIPNESSVKEFRVRAQVNCAAGVKLGDPLMCDPKIGGVQCTFVSAPTLRVEIACAN